MQTEIQNIVEELLSKVGVEGQLNVEEQEEAGEKVFMVNVDAPREAGLLIGAHGSTLAAIQSFVAIALKQKTGEWVRIVMDIGDWRQKHEEHLGQLAHQAAERAKATGEDQMLYNLTPSQRRVVHMALAKEEGVKTESEGEGVSRYLIVKPA